MKIYTLLAIKEDYEEVTYYIASFTDTLSVKEYIQKHYNCKNKFIYREQAENAYPFSLYKKLAACTSGALLKVLPEGHWGANKYTLHVYVEDV